MAASIYRSRRGQRAILARYDAALAASRPPATSTWLETTVGRTHVLVMGRADAPPLVLLPGGNFLTTTCLGWFAPLATNYRLYAPDLPGQPGLSTQARLATKGDTQARWLVHVFDLLGLARVPIVGISYGAGIALRLAGYAPERIAALGLVVPAGLVRGPLSTLLRTVAMPLLAYLLAPEAQRLKRATAPLLSEPDPHLSAEIGRAYRYLRLDSHLPRLATARELQRCHAPALVIAGGRDPFFPGAAVVRRARMLLPNVVETLIMAESKHIPSKADFAQMNVRLSAFLAEHHNG